MDDDLRVCGTGQAAMEAVAAEGSFLRAMRAWARGDRERAKPLIESAVAGWRHSMTVAREHVRYAHFLICGPAPRAGETSRTDLERVAAALDEQIAANQRRHEFDVMFLCRNMVQRALAAMLLEDSARAEALYREAIVALGKLWGDEHLEVGSYADDYATLLVKCGRLAEAEAQIARARAITEKSGFPYRGRD